MSSNTTLFTTVIVSAFVASLIARRNAPRKCVHGGDCPCAIAEKRRALPAKGGKGPPVPLVLAPGAEKWLCSCGKSASYPYCDGSHKGTSFKPYPLKNETDAEATFYVCTCGSTANAKGLCDGSHRKL